MHNLSIIIDIITKKLCQSVSVSGYAFRSVSMHLAETWLNGKEWVPEVCGQLFKVTRPKFKGHPEFKLLSECPMVTKLVGRTPDQSAMHSWDQRSCRGQLGSTRGQIAQEYSMATKFGRMGSKVM